MPKKAKKTTRRKAKRTKVAQPRRRDALKPASRKLPAAQRARLERLVRARGFDSNGAYQLDAAIFEAIDENVPGNYDRFNDVPTARAKYWAAWWFEGEVNNGGFHQFFLNKGPLVADAAMQFFKDVGPKDVAQLLQRAIKALPGGKLPKNHDAMMAILVPDDPEEDERLLAALEKIDNKFFDRDGDLVEGRLRFALQHADEFFE